MKIIVINGQGGCGKDTFVEFAKSYNVKTYNISMISAVKRGATQFGWHGGKELKDRKFLSDLKDLAADYNDFPFRMMLDDISCIIDTIKTMGDTLDDVIIFIHAREPEDIKRIVKELKAKTLLIRRTAVEKDYGNHADNKVFDYDYDYCYNNDKGLEEMEEDVKNFMNFILKQKWTSYSPMFEI